MQSSTGWSGAASRAVDGGTETYYGGGSCTHTNRERSPWWRVDVGAGTNVSAVKIWNRHSHGRRLNGAVIRVGDHAAKWDDARNSSARGAKNLLRVLRSKAKAHGGLIDRELFAEALVELGVGMESQEDSDALFDTFDGDSSGTIDLHELKTAFSMILSGMRACRLSKVSVVRPPGRPEWRR